MELKFKSRQSDSRASKPLSLALGGCGDVGKSQMHLGNPCPLGRSQQVGVGGRQARQQGLGCDWSDPGRWASSGVGESEAGCRGPGTETQEGVDGLSRQYGRIPRIRQAPSASGPHACPVPSSCDALPPDAHLACSLSPFLCLLRCLLLQEVFLTTLTWGFHHVPSPFLLYLSSHHLPPVDIYSFVSFTRI